MEIKQILGGIIILVIICWLFKQNTSKQETFCPRGYCDEDRENQVELNNTLKKEYPCKESPYMLGYDNPYIYPYNYGTLNLNHPVNRFKYPSWIRQTELDVNDYYGFPGYIY